MHHRVTRDTPANRPVGICRCQHRARPRLDTSTEREKIELIHPLVLPSFPKVMGHQSHHIFHATKPREE